MGCHKRLIQPQVKELQYTWAKEIQSQKPPTDVSQPGLVGLAL